MRRFLIGGGIGLVIGSTTAIVGGIALLRVPLSRAAATAEPILLLEPAPAGTDIFRLS